MTLQFSFATVCVLEIKIPQLKKTICRHVINTNFTESKQWLHLPRKELPKLNNGTDRMDLPLDREASVLWPSQPSTYAIL